ncbi:MAG TPA: response regulator [Candidatus Nitrosotenuis sp.]|nr:response regulator [Candidatus Nitrosotenuis sp.]
MTKRILIVEDEQVLSSAYETLLKQAGYEVEVAYDGKDALTKTTSFEPDLILLDLRMPVMDGVEFLKHYNLPKEHPNVKVILFSNYDMQEEIDEAYRLGADKYVLKAWVSPKELLHMVKSTIS